MVTKREAERAAKRAEAEKYGRDVQAALLVLRMRMDPSDAHAISAGCFEPSPKDQQDEHDRVRMAMMAGFAPADIPEWSSAGMLDDGHFWYKAGYTPNQARWVDKQVRSLFSQDDYAAGSDEFDRRRVARIAFIRNLLAEGERVERVVLALRAGPHSGEELLTWLRDARTDPGALDMLQTLAGVGNHDEPEPDDDY